MALIQKVALEGVRFFSYHGFYPEEQLVGNEFFLDIHTEMELKAEVNEDIANTVNYERLYAIASQHMKVPRKLLETVAQQIINDIVTEFSLVHLVEVSIRKMELPMPGEIQNSRVSLKFIR